MKTIKIQKYAPDNPTGSWGTPIKFDWDKAVNIIRKKKLNSAVAALAEDYMWSAGRILDGGEVTEMPWMHFFASDWATPCLYDEIHDVAYECWTELKDGEDFLTIATEEWWPESAKRKLETFI